MYLQVDHFGFVNTDSFQQRYLVADQFWNKDGGPIFFYTGNEGDIAWFCNNTGFMWDIAPQFKALLVFAEHRYYGESLPYGKASYKSPSKLNYLTSEQALADFAVLIRHIKESMPGAASSPVIAFGGSYGGMLASWFRMKYPNSVVGAVAASAPIWQFSGLVSCNAFTQTVTNTFKTASSQCSQNIRNVWEAINQGWQESPSDVSSIFHMCKPIKTKDDLNKFKGWIQESFTDLAMVDYPYPANFLEPLSAWPVKAACKPLSTDPLKGKELLTATFEALNYYYNYTGTTKCLNFDQEATQDLGTMGWDYQACTEMVMPTCTDGKSDMFEPSPWNFSQYADDCYKKWKVRPDLNWVTTHYGGKDLSEASNIIFSNGLLDPWSSGGVTKSQSDYVVAIVIPNGAHHLDLRSSNPDDPEDVISARKQEISLIQKWIANYRTKYHLN
ncbi:hypothetical protein FSP39_013477 [Pinctada imbricata]|uniref:Lysosomal Pro-X carboxypeptidase n=1 Tax=Pinctada imbricata TaxID=66713 RepID=A0AA88YMM2_PINIB|nr:hypothetical protein FSP39_013477 [Pinctada imbricata]